MSMGGQWESLWTDWDCGFFGPLQIGAFGRECNLNMVKQLNDHHKS